MLYVYMIRNAYGDLYIGVTSNPDRRLQYHNQKRGAQFTKRLPTYTVVFLERHENLLSARKREIQIKKWRREKKEMLIVRYERGLPTAV